MLPCAVSISTLACPAGYSHAANGSERAGQHRRGVSDAGRGGNYAVATHSASDTSGSGSYALARSIRRSGTPTKVAHGGYLRARRSPPGSRRSAPVPGEQRPDSTSCRRPSTEKALRSTPSRVIPSAGRRRCCAGCRPRSATRPGSGPHAERPVDQCRAARVIRPCPCASGASQTPSSHTPLAHRTSGKRAPTGNVQPDPVDASLAGRCCSPVRCTELTQRPPYRLIDVAQGSHGASADGPLDEAANSAACHGSSARRLGGRPPIGSVT